MRYFTRNNVLAFASCAALLFSACGDDSKNAGGSVEDQEIIAISDKTVTGVSQKGPFVNGSSVTVQELNGETLAQTGLGFEGKIKNDMGEFSVKVNKLESQYALLKANGFYRNEVTGEKSKSQVTLYALTDLSKRDEVNVNLLTHLAYERSLYLATEEDDVSVAEAKKQAETEVLKSFEIEGEFGDAEDLNIFGESDQSAALLAISVLMQGNLSEGDFSERLANYAADIESDGVWNDTKTATQIADWAITQSMSGGLALIRNNIAGWNLSTGVPAFEKYVDNFWWQNYGLGTCDKEREGEVKKNLNNGSINADKYFMCRSNLWYVATALEYDTYEWEKGKDADVKKGDVVTSNCYVFEDSVWRIGDENDCSLKLRGCTKSRRDTVGLGSDSVWYICDSKSWRKAKDIEKDTATWGEGDVDGEIRKGQINKDVYYIFEKEENVWRNATIPEYNTYQEICAMNNKIIKGKIDSDLKFVCDRGSFRMLDVLEETSDTACTSYNRDVFYILPKQYSYYKCTENGWTFTTEQLNQGTMTDLRDGHIYKTIGIKTQMWMAENLNYADSINFPSMLGNNACMEDKDSCARYGRYYSWSATIDSVYWLKQGKTCGYGENLCGLPKKVQGICPEGWHVPNREEWETLYSVVGDSKAMMAKGFDIWNQATDRYGFSAVPFGCYAENCSSGQIPTNIVFWSASEYDSDYAYFWYLYAYHTDLGWFDSNIKSVKSAVRCIQDN